MDAPGWEPFHDYGSVHWIAGGSEVASSSLWPVSPYNILGFRLQSLTLALCSQ